MPGTGMSLARFLAFTLYLALAMYLLSVALGFAAKKWPNALTTAAYRVVTRT